LGSFQDRAKDVTVNFDSITVREYCMGKTVMWATILLISLLGALGNILFKIGTKRWGSIPVERFLDLSFSLRYFFTLEVLVALAILFLGRFLAGSPLSVTGATQLFVVVTVLSLVFTAVLEAIILHRVYDWWTYLGIVIGLISIAMIARSI